MSWIRSFRWRIFSALLLLAAVPAAVAVVGGTWTLREFGDATGTLGPWDAVAASGARLADEAIRAAPDNAELRELARQHGDDLSEGVRLSGIWSLVSARVRELLPAAAFGGFLLLAGISALVARSLSRALSAPVGELVGWTERIARGEPLPDPVSSKSQIREFRKLHQALRAMDRRIAEAREREVQATQLRAWTEMARNVAHEIKNPLTPMRMSAAALARHGDPAVREAADVMVEEIARLDDMARSFSHFGRAPDGPPAPVDLEELLHILVERWHDSDVPVGLEVGGAIPLVLGHHDLLEGAVRNLIGNATEAVREGGGTGVRIQLEGGAGEARIRVRDDGPGIPEGLHDAIWVPDVTTRHRGTGLGLALVRRAAELHGGTATGTNLPGGGAEFVLTLPATGGAA